MYNRVKEFIDKLENGFPPMDHGYIVFYGGFWSNSIWYRFDLEAYCWQWTDDLVNWHSVIETNKNVNNDNMAIINYLRLKSLNKDIKIMSKDLEEIVHNLFINYKTLDRPTVDDKYKDDIKIQDYLNQLDYEFSIMDKTVANLISIEDNYQNERDLVKTRQSQRLFLTNYTNTVISEKMSIVDQRLKISYLINGLNMRLIQIMAPDHILDTYKMEQLEDDINQVCNFLDKKTSFVDNNRVLTSILNYQGRLLNSLGVSFNQNIAINNEFISKGISNLKEKNEKLNNTILNKNDQIASLENTRIEYFEKIKKLTNNEGVLVKNADECAKRLKSLELKYAILEASKMDLHYQNTELECSLSCNDDYILKLANENKVLSKNNDVLRNENTSLKEQLNKIIKLCPQIVYDLSQKEYVFKEDTYDMLEDN